MPDKIKKIPYDEFKAAMPLKQNTEKHYEPSSPLATEAASSMHGATSGVRIF